MFYNSANRDERAFADPFRFDVTRTPNEHAGFGAGGPHFCLGANLARREIRIMFEELFRRLPDIEISGEPDVPAEQLHPRHQAHALHLAHRPRLVANLIYAALASLDGFIEDAVRRLPVGGAR